MTTKTRRRRRRRRTCCEVGHWIGVVRRYTVTSVVFGRVWIEIDRVVVDDVEELLEGLHDEDQRNEQREALLREARDVAHLSMVDCGYVHVSER